MRIIKAGATSQSIYVEILDSTSTTGARKTGLAFNTAGMTAYYVRNGGSATAITLATLAAANSAYSSGGFKEVDATNMPGIYRLDVPNAAVAASAASCVVTIKGATGAVQVSVDIQLVAIDPQDATAGGLSRIDAAVSSRMATYTQPTGFLAASFPATVASTTNITSAAGCAVSSLGAGVITAASIAASALNGKGDWMVSYTQPTGFLAATFPATVSSYAGGAVASVTGSVGSVTGNVGGNVVGSVGSVTGAVGSVTGNVGGSVASVTAAVATTSNVKTNQALANFMFLMNDSTNHAPATGKTVSVTRSIDGAAFAAGTLSAVTEVANGWYRCDFAAADLNGKVIALRATAVGCDDMNVSIVTQP